MAQSLQELLNIEDPEDRYGEALDVILKLQDNVESSLRRLIAFRESWSTQELLVDRVEHWMSTAERGLAKIKDPSGGHMRQFWVGPIFNFSSYKYSQIIANAFGEKRLFSHLHFLSRVADCHTIKILSELFQRYKSTKEKLR